ncbi:MAG: cytochrome c3 family protein [Pirellulales bacterium]|nr:cytochrome c3 family protein [Pirellulales bacterium]
MPATWLRRFVFACQLALLVATVVVFCTRSSVKLAHADPPANEAASPSKELDPAAWGSDHVGQELPEYIEGGECLFCHRDDVGHSWAKNAHNRTIRDAEPGSPEMAPLVANEATRALAEEVKLVMGDRRAARYLKPGEAYGHADLLSVGAHAGRAGGRFRLAHGENPHWDSEQFNVRCAGCHTTAVDPADQSFATVSLDCFACHGDAPVEHANDATLMPLAKKRKDSPQVVTSLCGSCHIRFGKSRASGLPFPTNFVAGDNLFRDFEFDWRLADDEQINPSDRHVLANVRDVALYGREDMTCLSCHDVHTGSSKRHRELPRQESCAVCHDPAEPLTRHKQYEVHSERCEY